MAVIAWVVFNFIIAFLWAGYYLFFTDSGKKVGAESTLSSAKTHKEVQEILKEAEKITKDL